MGNSKTDVLVAGYQGIDEATEDFDALTALVESKQVSIEGAILVTHAEDGSVSVRQTADVAIEQQAHIDDLGAVRRDPQHGDQP